MKSLRRCRVGRGSPYPDVNRHKLRTNSPKEKPAIINKLSFYFNDKNMRDMTFKGYSIVYEVNFEKDCIEILKIFNRNKPS